MDPREHSQSPPEPAMTASYASLLEGRTSPGLFAWRGAAHRDLGAEARAAGRRVVEVDTSDVESFDDVQTLLARACGAPAASGPTLDPVFDALAELSREPVVVVWSGMERLPSLDPERTAALVGVLTDAIGVAESLSVVLTGDTGLNAYDGLL